MRLHRGLRIVWLPTGNYAVCSANEICYEFTDISDELATLLPFFERGTTLGTLKRHAQAKSIAIDELLNLKNQLKDLNLLEPASAQRLYHPQRAFWQRVTGNRMNSSLKSRYTSCIMFTNNDYISLQIAQGLALGRVGHFQLGHHSLYKSSLLGDSFSNLNKRPFIEAWENMELNGFVPKVDRQDHLPDLIVSVSWSCAHPTISRLALSNDVPLLSIVVGDSQVRVGPLWEPTGSGCEKCWKNGQDATSWRKNLSSQCGPDLYGLEPTLISQASAMATTRTLAFLDGRDYGKHQIVEIDVSGIPKVTKFLPLAQCGCQMLPITPIIWGKTSQVLSV